MKQETVILTVEAIVNATGGCPNREQAILLGIEWPLKHGWKFRAAGKKIAAEALEVANKLTVAEVRFRRDRKAAVQEVLSGQGTLL